MRWSCEKRKVAGALVDVNVEKTHKDGSAMGSSITAFNISFVCWFVNSRENINGSQANAKLQGVNFIKDYYCSYGVSNAFALRVG